MGRRVLVAIVILWGTNATGPSPASAQDDIEAAKAHSSKGVSLACTRQRAPVSIEPVTLVPSASPAPAAASAMPERVAPTPVPAPTLQTAGAETCHLDEAVKLGPLHVGHPVVAFTSRGGLVAWQTAEGTLAVQRLTSEGSTRGAATTVSVETGYEPKGVSVVAAGFLVLLDSVESRTGRSHDRGRAIAVDVDGHVLSTSSATEAGPMAPAPPPDTELSARIVNLATPPPRGPGGIIYEARPKPALLREIAGKRVGFMTQLKLRGNAVGVHGLSVDTALAWTGTRFVYPFTEGEPRMAGLLPIDCRR